MDLATQTHLRTIRAALLYRQSELHAAQRPPATQDGVGHEVSDQKDQAAQQASTAVDDEALRMEQEEAGRIEQALQRLDAGRFGDCQDCGEPIAWQRLQVQPAALRCASCQAAQERALAQGHARGVR